MITCKEDLMNTWIENDNGELAELYVGLCTKFGFGKFRSFEADLDIIGLYSCNDGNTDPWKLIDMEAGEQRECMRELTLEDLKPQTKEVEWVNGLPPVGVECEAVFIEHEHKGYGEFLILGYHSNDVWMEYIGELSNKSKHYTAKIDLVKFRKPETEAERKEREEIEAASYLLSGWFNAIGKDMPEWGSVNEDVKAHYLEIVRETNYKVKGE